MFPSVVVDDLHGVGVAVSPHKADSPLVVDPNAPLPCSVTLELLEPVRGWNRQIFESYCGIEHTQFPKGGPMQVGRNLPGAPEVEQPLRSEEHTSELQSRQYLVCR